jgi:hypothetical protein
VNGDSARASSEMAHSFVSIVLRQSRAFDIAATSIYGVHVLCVLGANPFNFLMRSTLFLGTDDFGRWAGRKHAVARATVRMRPNRGGSCRQRGRGLLRSCPAPRIPRR